MWERQRKRFCSRGGKLPVEAQPPCSGAGTPKGAQPHLGQGLQTTLQGQQELCTGWSCSSTRAAAMRAQLPAPGAGSALTVLPFFGSAQGLSGNIRAKAGAALGCARSSLAGNHSRLAPWALSLPVPGAASLNLPTLHPSGSALAGGPTSLAKAGGGAKLEVVQQWTQFTGLSFLPPFSFLREAH